VDSLFDLWEATNPTRGEVRSYAGIGTYLQGLRVLPTGEGSYGSDADSLFDLWEATNPTRGEVRSYAGIGTYLWEREGVLHG
jgi:hypothetical protein